MRRITHVRPHTRKNWKKPGMHNVKGHIRRVKVRDTPSDVKWKTLEPGDTIYESSFYPNIKIIVPRDELKYAGRWDAETDAIYIDRDAFEIMDDEDLYHLVRHEVEEMSLHKEKGLSIEEAHKKAYPIREDILDKYDSFKEEYVHGHDN